MTALFDPAEHRPLAGAHWNEATARDEIAEIANDAIGAYRGPRALWPNHPDEDFTADEAARAYRSVYLGAAGMAWALHRLAGDGLAPALPGLAELAAALPTDYLAAPELTEAETGTPPPPPGLLFGESGILLALEAIETASDADARHPTDRTATRHARDVRDVRHARRARLADRIAANARNPTRELCWGSPGTMLAALAMHRATGDHAWREAYVDSATWLLDEWQDPVWVQDMYGTQARYLGAGHGFAGNALALLAGADLLDEATAGALRDRVAKTVAALAQRDDDDGLAQWPGLADRVIERRPVQWCHGSPGIVCSLRALPADPEIDALLAAGGELTWRAGPLRKGAGLCHGTAGNGYALLALYGRTGEERWLERARAFAMDAAADVTARRARHGRGRYTLFTGDVGVALLLRACLDGRDPGFPFLERPLG